MEECEALCTSLAIMVNGRFCCLGSPQQLKAKFSTGYSLRVKLQSGHDQMENVQMFKTFITQKFPNINLRDENGAFLSFTISTTYSGENNSDINQSKGCSSSSTDSQPVHNTDSDIRLSYIFELLDVNKIKLNIEDYSVSQTTLEQVFMQFAKDQVETL